MVLDGHEKIISDTQQTSYKEVTVLSQMAKGWLKTKKGTVGSRFLRTPNAFDTF